MYSFQINGCRLAMNPFLYCILHIEVAHDLMGRTMTDVQSQCYLIDGNMPICQKNHVSFLNVVICHESSWRTWSLLLCYTCSFTFKPLNPQKHMIVHFFYIVTLVSDKISAPFTPSDNRNLITAHCSSLVQLSDRAAMIYFQQRYEKWRNLDQKLIELPQQYVNKISKDRSQCTLSQKSYDESVDNFFTLLCIFLIN